ncbi:MAG: DUF4126 domain-containing protein [Cyanophyceae cyanobacterium]
MLTALLAVFSASAAAGMRIALPLTVICLLYSHRWQTDVSILKYIHPQVILSILVSWSLFELLASKKLLGQRILQLIQLILCPVVGCLMGIVVLQTTNLAIGPVWLVGMSGGGLALVLKLVEVGWFFRLRGLPLWVVFAEDLLCTCLVLFAFEAPQQGGIVAMLLLWLAIRTSNEWRRWYSRSASGKG